ncbi:cobalt-precorrin-7 (C(5))-methyltransferase [Furfurilactobacillus sp. WILCCON 0119]
MITVLGIGPGAAALRLAGTNDWLTNADYVIGAPRQLETLAVPEKKAVTLPPLATLEQWLHEHHADNVVLLASGDPLQYGIGNWVVKHFDATQYRIIPGISAIQYCFHQFGLSLNDVYITSSHGRKPDFDFLLRHQKVGMVTDTVIGPAEIAAAIRERGLHRTLYVGERLSYPDEQLSKWTEQTVPERDYQLNVVVIVDEG